MMIDSLLIVDEHGLRQKRIMSILKYSIVFIASILLVGCSCETAETRQIRRQIRKKGIKNVCVKADAKQNYRVELQGGNVSNLAALEGLPISKLRIINTSVTDLVGIQSLPLRRLVIHNSPIEDLSPLAGMQVQYVELINTSVSNLSPLASCPILALSMKSPLITNGFWEVYDTQSLMDINGMQAYSFIRKHNMYRVPDESFLDTLDELTEPLLDQQIEESPDDYLEKYGLLAKRFTSYDMNAFSEEQKRVGVVMVHNLGTAYVHLGQPGEALLFLWFAVDMLPDEIIVHRNLALTFFFCGERRQSASFYRGALKEYQIVQEMAPEGSRFATEAKEKIELIESRLRNMRRAQWWRPRR